ncbi:ABC transporter substrate-binding protein [Streptomyces sp. NPDC047072]|uniref:ABC transporter substrate-binding protein n=1 Tax=Streptomyces sp. NPDC047072 TaxID=3154809 RepID=UPI0033FA34EA
MNATYAARAAAGALAALLVLAGCSSKARNADHGDGDKASASPMKTGVGVSGKTITLGALTDMTGAYATLGKSVTQAQQLYVKQLNAAGGACGYKVQLAIRDHGYDPQKALSGYAELEPKVLGFVQFIGSPFVAAVQQRIHDHDKGLVLPQTWSAALDGYYIRTIGSTYDMETMNAIDFLMKEKGIKKGDRIGHVYVEGDYGEGALRGSKHVAQLYGLTVVEQKIKPTDNDMTAQVAALRKAGVKAIVLSAGPRQAASLVGVAAAGGFDVPVIGNHSAFAPRLLATRAGPALTRNYWVASPWLPIGADTPEAKKLVADYRAAYPKDALDNDIVAGWIAASAFGEVLKRACARKDLTREGVLSALPTTDSLDLGFGVVQGFTDFWGPSARASVILRPDKSVTGGLRVVREPTVSEAASAYVDAD